MPSEAELIAERKRKLEELRKKGVNPYPYKYEPTDKAALLQRKYEKLAPEEQTEDLACVAGRLMALRRMGKASFSSLQDGSGKIQLYFKQDITGEEQYEILKLLDIGDIVGVKGRIFKTKTGELTIEAKELTLLCKSLRPMPDKWSGLQDIEARYRQRYLDLIMNPAVRETFAQRAKIIDAVRDTLNRRGFLEMDTPTLQAVYGGGNAKPFKTHLNALDQDVYLRIANELHLKRLLVGGFEKVYEFAKDFRNEDIDRTHNPEFTQVEMYQSYADYEDMMDLCEDIYVAAAKAIHGGTKFKFGNHEIDVKKPWQRLTMVQAIKKYADIDVDKLPDRELFDLRLTFNLEVKGDITRGSVIQALFEALVEDKLIQPTFITEHPKESTPLAKPSRHHHLFVERFEPFIAGIEIGNAYSELNDPELQRTQLEHQACLLRAGSAEAHPMDEDFVRAIEHGMPPAGGLGLGIDRMCMFILGQESIRDVLLFPFMKTAKTDGH